MKKKRIKNVRFFVMIGAFIVLIFVIVFVFKTIKYRGTYEYKLKKIGYENDYSVIIKNMEEKELDILLEKPYSATISKLVLEKYFLFKNLDRYLAYSVKFPDKSMKEVVAIVNVSTDKDFYSDVKDTDLTIDDPYLILTNKYNKLPSSYKPEEIRSISNQFAYAGMNIDASIYGNLVSMFNTAKKDGYTLIVTSGYRDYALQESLVNDFILKNGKEKADSFSARPGHSEHQLGFALDIVRFGMGVEEKFETTPEFEWLSNNAYKFGFILRYPKDKTHITGYIYEPWHYRYVGEEVAKYIYENDITFDEYYAFYIEK